MKGVAKDAGSRIGGIGVSEYSVNGSACPSTIPRVPGSKTLARPLRYVYKSKPDRKQGAQPEQFFVEQGGSH